MKTRLLSFFIFSATIFLHPYLLAKNSSFRQKIQDDTIDKILINQIGFNPNAVKIALIRGKFEKFEVLDTKSNKVVFKGITGEQKYWDQSGDSVRVADFTKVFIPGQYKLCLNNKSICSSTFEIRQNVLHSIAKASIKAFYFNRSGMDILSKYGGKWARQAGHPDTIIYIHSSATSDKRPEGHIISSHGGWYDAGDYNKYIVNSSISAYTLMLFHQVYPSYSKKINTDIPESKNNISDVIDELLYNLRWMLTMQDPNDGGVYHKLTNKKFGDFTMPDKATEPRYVVKKSTAASLDFAATMAMASRIFKKNKSRELQKLSNTCLIAAQKAYAWARSNPKIFFKNPVDISTGEYDDTDVSDEFFWAAVELGLAENKMTDLTINEIAAQKDKIQSWDRVGFLGIMSLSLSKSPNVSKYATEAQKILTAYADKLVETSKKSPYCVSLDFFKWGSNSDVANQAIIKLIAYKISGNSKYLASVQGDVDYILGRNATGYCFVSGYGSKQVMNIHHRPSGADEVKDPCPGFLSGGPNTVTFADCPDITRSKFPARSFVDDQCSYSTNEIAINWNAPLFFMLGAVDFLSK